MSKSDSVAYLCEPITQPYLMKEGGKYALVDVNNDSLAFSRYAKLGDDIFRGVPPAHSGVVADLHEFSIFQRINRHILIKEVNPRAAEFYCARYGPKILFLLRHPAAVALSFSQQGWLDSPDTQLETGNSDASVWERFGFAYGSIMKNALEVIKSSDHEVLMYEDLALNSEREFEKLFRLLGLKRPKNYKAIMQRYCYSKEKVKGAFHTERDSRNMVYKWCKQLSPQEILWLKEGYGLSGLEFYRNDSDCSCG